MEDEKLPGLSAEDSAEAHAACGRAERSGQQTDPSGRGVHPHKLAKCDDRASDKEAAAGIMVILLCSKPVTNHG